MNHKRCSIKELDILQCAQSYYYAHHQIDLEIYIESWIMDIMKKMPSYCPLKKCYGGMPLACECGCDAGSKRCNKSHLNDE
jgi:hypothetical protein